MVPGPMWSPYIYIYISYIYIYIERGRDFDVYLYVIRPATGANNSRLLVVSEQVYTYIYNIYIYILSGSARMCIPGMCPELALGPRTQFGPRAWALAGHVWNIIDPVTASVLTLYGPSVHRFLEESA